LNRIHQVCNRITTEYVYVQQSISCTFSGAIEPDIIIIFVDLFKQLLYRSKLTYLSTNLPLNSYFDKVKISKANRRSNLSWMRIIRPLRLSVCDPNTSSRLSGHALCVIHLSAHALRTRGAGPEAVPQRADNCVTHDEKHRDGRRCISDRVTSALNSGWPEDGEVLQKQRDRLFQHCRN